MRDALPEMEKGHRAQGALLRVMKVRRLSSPLRRRSGKEKPPPFPVRVVQYKAPGGDLLRPGHLGWVAIYDRRSNTPR